MLVDVRAIKTYAHGLGFDPIGIASADDLPDAEQAILDRVRSGMLDGMPWLGAERARAACRPRERFPWARSIISLAFPYGPASSHGSARAFSSHGTMDDPEVDGKGARLDPSAAERSPIGIISRYAVGEDYHRVLGRKLKELTSLLSAKGVPARAFVDTSALAERALAVRAGIGWFGKSTNVLTPRYGSWVFLAEVITGLELEPDKPLGKSCGSCSRCLEACPTGALLAPYVLDSRRCISFLTIELRGGIPVDIRKKLGNSIFGCDICQEVCPVNARVVEIAPQEMRPAIDLGEILSMTEEVFASRFGHTALRRSGLIGLRRNAMVALENVGGE